MDERLAHERRRVALLETMAGAGSQLGLHKDSSNLFRDRRAQSKRLLDVRAFSHVLGIDPEGGWVDAEGMVPYDALAKACLGRSVMPAVVPELKSITLGGAAAGVGVEASSFRWGLVHHTLQEIEVLTGRGESVLARPDNEHRDLFLGFPNSYGSLGYALRLKARTLPVKPFVELHHERFSRPDESFRRLRELAEGEIDFLEAVVFGDQELVVSSGRFCDQAPWVSDYSYRNIYYRSLRARERDYLTTWDYIWRWDTDWFWCSKNLGAQNPLIRRLLGRERLNSRFYTRLMRWNSRIGLTRRLDRLSGRSRESVIQDVDIPIGHAEEFLAFLHEEIGILPVWLCPIRVPGGSGHFPLYPLPEGELWVNFGFWDVVRRRHSFPAGHHNRLIERKVQALGGIKSLYSDSYFPPEEFWQIYGGEQYRQLKERYDPQGVFPDLYEKTVMRR